MEISIHCDGSYIHEQQASGAGVIISEGGKELLISRKLYDENPSCMRAELNALLIGLEEIKEKDFTKINIFTDSLNTVKCVTGVSKRRSNRDLWTQIEDIFFSLKDKAIEITHVNKKDLQIEDTIYKMNMLADQLAYQGANSLI